MSANNQILVKAHTDGWYIFEVAAESWGVNELPLSLALEGPHEVLDKALIRAHQLQDLEQTEYGVHLQLAKDGADVVVVDDRS